MHRQIAQEKETKSAAKADIKFYQNAVLGTRASPPWRAIDDETAIYALETAAYKLRKLATDLRTSREASSQKG